MENLQKAPKTTVTIIGVVLVLVLCTAGLWLSDDLFKWSGLGKDLRFIMSRFVIWGLLLIMFIYSRRVEHQPLVGWPNQRYPVYFHLLGVFAIMITLFIGNIIIGIVFDKLGLLKESKRFAELVPMFRKYPGLIFFTSITAGIVEELLFRGYMIPRLQKLLRSDVWAIIISSVLFGLTHYSYGTAIQIAGPIFIGAVFAVYYVKYRDIHTIIICHFLWDMMSLTLKMKMH